MAVAFHVAASENVICVETRLRSLQAKASSKLAPNELDSKRMLTFQTALSAVSYVQPCGQVTAFRRGS